MTCVSVFRFLVVCLFLPLSLTVAGEPSASDPAKEWVVRSWRTADGLPQNSVNALRQTRDGFLWIGTSGGLARFDGIQFQKFGLQDGLRSVHISELVEDRGGRLWIGTTGGGISYWEKGRFHSFGPEEGFPAGADVVSLAASLDGSVWVGTEAGLVKWSNGTFTTIGEAQGLPRNQVRALLYDSKGTLWVSVIPEGVFHSQGSQFVKVDPTGPFTGGVYSLAEGHDGAIWGGAGNGRLWRWRDGTWRCFETKDGLPKTSFTALTTGSDGTLWMGTSDYGLYRGQGETFSPASESELPRSSVHAVSTDRDGSVWVGTNANGLRRLSRRMLHYWDTSADLGPAIPQAIAEAPSGTWWLGAAAKGIFRLVEGHFVPVEDPVISPRAHHIYTSVTSSDGTVWEAGEQCLYRFHSGQTTKAYLDGPIAGEAIRALCADGETLWLGTYYSTLLKCDASGVTVAAPRGSFSGNITSMVLEAPGVLWIGSSGGLHRWESGKIRSWGTHDGLLSASIRALYRDPDGTLWIGTLGGGLSRLKDGQFVNLTTAHGLNDDVISQLATDDLGGFWIGGNHGIIRLERKELEAVADGQSAELHPMIFGRNEGLLDEQCVGGHSPTVCKTKDGHLIFPLMSGIAEFDPRRVMAPPTSPPQAVIERLLIDGHPPSLDEPLVLPPGKHRVELKFTAPALSGGEWLRFRHRLDGFDPTWVTSSNDRSAFYDGLRPGTYTFHVEATDAQGNWSNTGASLSFTIQPFFYQTFWFRASLVALLVSVGGATVYWQARRKHRRHLAELEQARRQHAELAHVGRVSLLGELSASIAHELNQPLTAILSNAQAALRFLNQEPVNLEEVRAILQDITAANHRASEVILRMRAMMKKGEAQLEQRDLNADIEQVLTLLHSDLVARNVTVTTEFGPGLPLVNGDHIQLQQVLLNLIINGCDAMQRLEPDDRHLRITTVRDGAAFVRVSVTDHGSGIPAEKMDRIFEPFFSTKEHGLGMGLSICRAIVKAHGGSLWAESEPGAHATFHFTLTTGAPVTTEITPASAH